MSNNDFLKYFQVTIEVHHPSTGELLLQASRVIGLDDRVGVEPVHDADNNLLGLLLRHNDDAILMQPNHFLTTPTPILENAVARKHNNLAIKSELPDSL